MTMIQNDAYAVDTNLSLRVDARSGVTRNDSLPAGTAITLVSGATNGSVALSADGSFTYIPNAGFAGSDSFTYGYAGAAGQETATVDIRVRGNLVARPFDLVIPGYDMEPIQARSLVLPGGGIATIRAEATGDAVAIRLTRYTAGGEVVGTQTVATFSLAGVAAMPERYLDMSLSAVLVGEDAVAVRILGSANGYSMTGGVAIAVAKVVLADLATGLATTLFNGPFESNEHPTRYTYSTVPVLESLPNGNLLFVGETHTTIYSPSESVQYDGRITIVDSGGQIAASSPFLIRDSSGEIYQDNEITVVPLADGGALLRADTGVYRMAANGAVGPLLSGDIFDDDDESENPGPNIALIGDRHFALVVMREIADDDEEGAGETLYHLYGLNGQLLVSHQIELEDDVIADIAVLDDGTHIVVWAVIDGDGDDFGTPMLVRAQVFSAAGARIGSTITFGQYVRVGDKDGTAPLVATNGGSFLIAAGNNTGFVVSASGVVIDGHFRLSGQDETASVVRVSRTIDDRILLQWDDGLRLVDLPGTRGLFSGGAEEVNFNALTADQLTLVARAASNPDGLYRITDALDGEDIVRLPDIAGYRVGGVISWDAGRTFFAGGGNDRITGGDGDDKIAGGSGDDVLRGGAGADILIGGTVPEGDGLTKVTAANGVDVVLYEKSRSSYEISSVGGHWKVKDASPAGKTDILYNIEYLIFNYSGDIDPNQIAIKIDAYSHASSASAEMYRLPYIYLDFDSPIPYDYRSSLTFSGLEMERVAGSAPLAGFSSSQKQDIVSGVQAIFDRSGVEVVVVSGVPPTREAGHVVRFSSKVVSAASGNRLLGQAYDGVNRFNLRPDDDVAVWMGSNDTLSTVIETAAHEVAHALGLRHINPSHDANEVMDYHRGLEERFVNSVEDVRESPRNATIIDRDTTYAHNNMYHILRYFVGMSPAELALANINPGNWDVGAGEKYVEHVSFHILNVPLVRVVLKFFSITESVEGGSDQASSRLVEIARNIQAGGQISFELNEGETFSILGSTGTGTDLDVLVRFDTPNGPVTELTAGMAYSGATVVKYNLSNGQSSTIGSAAVSFSPGATDYSGSPVFAAGPNSMTGTMGDDTYYVDNAGDIVVEGVNGGIDTVISSVSYTLPANVESLVLTGSAFSGKGNALDNLIHGTALNNALVGYDGNDTLDGDKGADTMTGGKGDDTYYVDNAGDTIVEANGEGTDTVLTVFTHSLAGTFIENATLLGTSNLNLTGNGLNNVLTGNAGNNFLSGSTGADTMIGGVGDDSYSVDNAGDVIVELAGQGYDSVNSSTGYALSANVEKLTLTGSLNSFGTGNALDNWIIGNGGSNVLDGGLGADKLQGGLGDDSYYIDNVADVIVEANGEGTDTARATIDYSLAGTFLENLILLGTANLAGTGNGLANVITGNAGNNVINGGSGADRMVGGLGDDTYSVDNTGDVVVEANSQGIDTIRATVTYSLAGQFIENLIVVGNTNLGLTGNSVANTLTGNSGANVIDGGIGNDRLIGGLGADTLTGGNGADTFVFDSILFASNVDTITDFTHNTDKIELAKAIFTALGAPGTLAAGAFWLGTAAHDADDRIIYNSATGRLTYDADGTGSGDPVHFATLGTGLGLTVTNFIVA